MTDLRPNFPDKRPPKGVIQRPQIQTTEASHEPRFSLNLISGSSSLCNCGKAMVMKPMQLPIKSNPKLAEIAPKICVHCLMTAKESIAD